MTTAAVILDWLARAGTVIALVSWIIVFVRRRVRRTRVQRFFGGGRVDVLLPLRTLDDRAAVSVPDFMTGLALQRFLTKFGVDIRFRFLRPEDSLHLETPGTVVVCGPKNSPEVNAAMRRDPVLAFSEDARGWTLEAAGVRYRSKSDAGEAHGADDATHSDIGYLSRTVERIGGDSERVVIWIAGVHAPGSAIVADRLCRTRSIRRARRLAPSGRFSAVIGGTYSANPLRVRTSQKLFFAAHPERPGGSTRVPAAP
ncbi:hypothetical protein GCM10009847_26010 [Leucobacter tardus]|uniref:Uncharacterized protein n=1 Tax=Leucobacter tardus TaxID=501483 RepID=A0A939TN69_9MICO|nr:hypothetical protein [Leucobacter tardus]MBO2989894.1 hypothetical protein [Leucobacter tardus]